MSSSFHEHGTSIIIITSKENIIHVNEQSQKDLALIKLEEGVIICD